MLAFPNLTSIDMGPADLVTLQIEAVNGGQVNLPLVTHISDDAGSVRRQAHLLADGTGSRIDLSSLVNFTLNSLWSDAWRSKMIVRSGGIIEAPNLTTLRRVDVTLDGTGTLATANWQTWSDGIATLSGSNYSVDNLAGAASTQFNLTGGSVALPELTSLTDGQLSLVGGATAIVPQLTNINGASLLVTGGVTLTLPNVTSYSRPESSGTKTLRSSGVGSVLELPTLIGLRQDNAIAAPPAKHANH